MVSRTPLLQLLLAGAVLVVSTASAQTPPSAGAKPAASASAASAAGTATAAGAKPAVSASAGAAASAGPDTMDKETLSKRSAYVRTTRAKIKEAVRANNKEITHGERTSIGVHWRHAMRLFRVRSFAAKAKEADVVAKCDALLQKEDDKFFASLKEMNAKAPERKAGADAGAAPARDGGK